MSTRTRIALTYKGRFHCCGGVAIGELLRRVYPHALHIKNKLKLIEGNTKREKMEKLAQKLPEGFALIFIQEPKRTRKNRSLYWKVRANKPLENQQNGGLR